MRIQDVAQGPDGAIFVLTDDPNDGHMLKITAAE
jgi:glucose/arabinose dehydrogenase